jgi:hypothetical protein
MTDSIKREIGRLLDEPGDLPATGEVSDRLRARLTATVSEGLGSASAGSSATGTRDIAAMAAFIDGQLTGAARDKFVADLAQQQNLRADVESTADLVYATSDSPLEVPRHLLARASAQFAPAQPPQTTAQQAGSRWDPSALLSAFLPRQRIAWAMVAALALIVAVPAGLMMRGQSGGGQPELSGVEEPAVSQQQKDKACEDWLKEMSKKDASKQDLSKVQPSKSALPDSPSAGTPPKDPAKNPAKDLAKNPSKNPCDRNGAAIK